jgi:hypothetical protein
MNKNLIALVLCTVFFLIPAQAEIVNLNSNMDCAKADAGAGTCASGGTGTGIGTMTLDTVTNDLNWNVSHSGLSAAVTAAHFHGPALPDQNAGVQVDIGISSPSIGSTVLTPAQAADLLAGLWYINIHSANFPAGEIRGQVDVVSAPTCDIQLNQVAYVDGDTVIADVFRVANLTSAPVAVELKVWQGLPDSPPISFLNIGADGSFVLAAGADIDRGPFPLLSVTPDLPRGTHEISCRVLDPVTGALLAEDLNNFEILGSDLVTNPGFEDGATGWTFSDGNPDDGRDVGTCPSTCTVPHTGSWAGFKNLFDGGSGTISQSIATSIGTEYLVELWLARNSVGIGTVTASFGSTLGVSVTEADVSLTHAMYSFTHTATSTSTDFVFGGVVTQGTFFIDDVSIVAIP